MNPLAVDHPYYCEAGNYYANGADVQWESWADFLEECESMDIDMNLVIRWDWTKHHPDDYDDDDPMPDHDSLQLVILGQRKALLRSATIAVSDADAESVAAFLKPHWERICQNWSPISDAFDTPAPTTSDRRAEA